MKVTAYFGGNNPFHDFWSNKG